MDFFEDFILHQSGRPILLSGEVEVAIAPSVELNRVTTDLILRLTTHRVLLHKPNFSKQIHLQNIVQVVPTPHGWISKSTAFKLISTSGKECELSIPENRDSVLTSFSQQRPWETKEDGNQEKVNFNTSGAGISGILKKTEDQHTKTKESLENAFSDLNALMENAKSMVALAQRLRDRSKSDDSEVNNLMLNIGIDSPVTKTTSGNLFYEDLSRQLSEFLAEHLKENNGIMPLTDVYCLYNRARGTALVSPEDLYRSCLLFDQLSLPVQLRKFDSGILVVQSLQYNDKIMLDSISKLVVEGKFPLTATQFASLQQLSIPLARYYLEKAEQEVVLCRDESFEGLIFYANIFA